MKSLRTAFYTLIAITLSANAVAGHHKEGKDIVDTAASAGTFKTLIAAAKAAGLAGALKGDGPLTVFAPTDDAFSALPAGTIETLLKPENKAQLANILKFHVVSGDVRAAALADGVQLETLAGASAQINQTEGGFNIENARIIKTDLATSNGVIHVIDRVILPPQLMSRAAAAERIGDAIDRGVPMFNHGNAHGTVTIYMTVANDLLRLGDLSREEKSRLTLGMQNARAERSASASAWQLRYALDDVNESLHSGMQMAMNQ